MILGQLRIGARSTTYAALSGGHHYDDDDGHHDEGEDFIKHS